MESHATPEGVDYLLLDPPGPGPKPTLLIVALRAEDSLGEPYGDAGRILWEFGYLTVTLDIPNHGAQERPTEAGGLPGWAERHARGDDFVAEYIQRAGAVLDDLVRRGWTDPTRIVACGTSRGGFLSLRLAASDPRIAGVAAVAPVTDLRALREFAALKEVPLVVAADLENHAEALAGRPIWMCISTYDERVDTDRVIAFTRATVKQAMKKELPPDLELHLLGYASHGAHPTAYQEAADWIHRRWGDG